MVFTLALFYFVSRLVAADRLGSPDEYFAFVAVGLVIISVLHSALGLAETLQRELVAGTFERSAALPLRPGAGHDLDDALPDDPGPADGGLDAHRSRRSSSGSTCSGRPAALALPLGFLCALAFAASRSRSGPR